jgi:hypothetical protein
MFWIVDQSKWNRTNSFGLPSYVAQAYVQRHNCWCLFVAKLLYFSQNHVLTQLANCFCKLAEIFYEWGITRVPYAKIQIIRLKNTWAFSNNRSCPGLGTSGTGAQTNLRTLQQLPPMEAIWLLWLNFSNSESFYMRPFCGKSHQMTYRTLFCKKNFNFMMGCNMPVFLKRSKFNPRPFLHWMFFILYESYCSKCIVDCSVKSILW